MSSVHLTHERPVKRQKLAEQVGNVRQQLLAPIRVIHRKAKALCHGNQWTEEEWTRARGFAMFGTYLDAEQVEAMSQEQLCGLLSAEFPPLTAKDIDTFARMLTICSHKSTSTKHILQGELTEPATLQILETLGIDEAVVRDMSKRQLCQTLGLVKYNGQLRANWCLTISEDSNTHCPVTLDPRQGFWRGQELQAFRRSGKIAMQLARSKGQSLPDYEVQQEEEESAETEEDSD